MQNEKSLTNEQAKHEFAQLMANAPDNFPKHAKGIASMVLNNTLQIIHLSDQSLDLFDLEDEKQMLGKRPGDFFCCQNASEGQKCTTTKYCNVCGLFNTILKAKKMNVPITGQCTITQGTSKELKSAIELEISATPLSMNGQSYIFVNFRDISSNKRLHMLEKVFFHDIINTTGTIAGIVDLFKNDLSKENIKTFLPDLDSAVTQLVEEILSQRDLISAEHEDLRVQFDTCNSHELINKIIKQYTNFYSPQHKTIQISAESSNIEFISDSVILKRILGNMLKNAIEAPCEEENKTITVGSRYNKGEILLWINNPGVLAPNFQLQIFKRSFSTKSPNRGLGTYSMKLFTTKYLHGKIWFESTPENGTTFFVQFPLRPPE